MQQEEYQGQHPTKRAKIDKNNEEIPPQIFCNCFTPEQTNQILSALSGLLSYTKYVSVLIRHQEKSLLSVPASIKLFPQFKELTERVNQCIARAKVNNLFLQKIVANYSPYIRELVNSTVREPQREGAIASSVFNAFIHIIREWSGLYEANIRPMKHIVQLVGNYLINQDGQKRSKIFVQGVGMGRIVAEIWQAYGNKISSMQGCQDRVFHYLFAEYFLANYKNKSNSSTLYPFIHNFTNNYDQSHPYSEITVPNFPQSQTVTNPAALALTFGGFQYFFKSSSYNRQWDILISYLCNDRIHNVLKWIQIAYKNLSEHGIWIIACYGSWQRNVIPLSQTEFRQIVSKSMFKIISETINYEYLINDPVMTKQKLKVHYFVLGK